MERRGWRVAISAFIVWNGLVVLLTNCQEIRVPPTLLAILEPYARATRLMQRWSLFCPEPRRYSAQYAFEITRRDGSRTRWSRPLPPQWGFFARHHASNWQKLDSASNRMETPFFWPGLARWAEREFRDDSNPPTQISLYKLVTQTPPPGPDGAFWQIGGEKRELKVFDYWVATGELRR
jgi:hypothetical protein